jgi:hypothetical protein
MRPAATDGAPTLFPVRVGRRTEATAQRLQEWHHRQRRHGSQGIRIDVQGSREGFNPVTVGVDSRLEERPAIECLSIRHGAEANCLWTRFRGQGQHATHPAIGESRIDENARSGQERRAGRVLSLKRGGGSDGVPGSARSAIGRFFQDRGEHAQPGGRFRLGREDEINLTARTRGKCHGANEGDGEGDPSGGD